MTQWVFPSTAEYGAAFENTSAHSSRGTNSTTSGPRPGSKERDGISRDDGGELRSSTCCRRRNSVVSRRSSVDP